MSEEKHPIVQAEMGLVLQPEEPVKPPEEEPIPIPTTIARAEAEAFIEGFDYCLQQFERIRDSAKKHGEGDKCYVYLQAIIQDGVSFRNLAKVAANARWPEFDPFPPATKRGKLGYD